MAVVIPEVLLYTLVKGILLGVKEDYLSCPDKSDSIISKVFEGVKDDKADYYNEAVSIFVEREAPNHPRALRLRLFFDNQQAAFPSIHIMLGNDSPGQDSLGIGEIAERSSYDASFTTKASYHRRFDSQYQIVIVSESTIEVVIIYHLLRALLISCLDTLELEGIENLKISGGTLNIKEELIPTNLFVRSINLTFSFDIEVPSFFKENTINELILGSITPIIS